MNLEQIGLWAGFALTLMVYSYLIGDNFLYRIAVYVAVGLAAGYIAIVTTESVLLPWFRTTIGSGEPLRIGLGMLPVLFGVLLLLKTSARLSRLGSLGLAFLIGIGAAVALVGALTGTLIPLSFDTIAEGEGDLLNAVLIFIGVASSLLYFQYLARRTPEGTVRRFRLMQGISTVGLGFLTVTFGALYAAAILTSLTIFSERVGYLLTLVGG
jgi:hypothetical protein